MPYVLVLSTVPSRKEAFRLASILLNEKLAACVNVSSRIDSLYWWKGKKEKSREYFLFIKTKPALFKKLARTIGRNHPYSVPEIIAIPITSGNLSYLHWIDQTVRRK